MGIAPKVPSGFDPKEFFWYIFKKNNTMFSSNSLGQTNITTIVLLISPNRNKSFKRRFKIIPMRKTGKEKTKIQ